MLDVVEASWMERDITMEEVEYALKCSPSKKALGADGVKNNVM